MRTLIMSTALTLGTAIGAMAETIEIEMLNKNDEGERMVFSEELIRAEIGDVIRFVPTDKSHNAASVKNAVPEGQEPFRGKINKAVEYEVTEAGLTAVICTPHQAMGMVALIMVNDDVSNAEQILDARIPGKGGKKIEALVEEARASVVDVEEEDEQTS
ncbi:pseudoazurin [Litoreibacter ponti]|uniref:Pseudoazurin n=1 Tax=Litoreibacter ponti TaxID=1510457 RepID=A0A2T6BKR9_9RHOB|nr:plastocyanin/azurin family copper-binding protein [Litoreibacter ponti]PTX56655.1 pseudoazurin [Litoreibacter ponti]